MVSSIRQNSLSPLSRLKSANYLNHVLARKEARTAGADEALLLNERGFLCEGSTSNVFLIQGDTLVTPGEESGCLPGITRQTVIEIASGLGIAVVQRDARLEELLQAEEAFITNSLLEIMRLAKVDGKPVGRGAGKSRGVATAQRLRRAYGELVEEEGAGPLP